MNYQSVENVLLNYPESNFKKFARRANQCVEDFTKHNAAIKLIDDDAFEMEHLHSLLNALFHQVYNSSSSFALGGAMCDSRYFKIREYLFHHAEEEQDHWKWIIQNLRDTGFCGADPRETFPSFQTQAYISFAMFLAHRQPVARLAMAFVLEGLSGALGIEYGAKVAQHLGLNKQQLSFFLLHGELDKGHSHDILDVLESASLTSYEWAWCEYAADCTLYLYRDIYNSAMKMIPSAELV